MQTGRWAYIGSLILVLLARTSMLQAQATPAAQEASSLLSAGELAYAQGRFGDALDCFEASYRKRQEPLTLRRVGDAADKLGSHARAIEALKSYLLRVPNARDRVFIESRIDANQAALDAVRQQTLLAASSAKASTDSKNKSLASHEIHQGQQGQQGFADSSAPAAALTQTQSEASGNRAGPFWLWAAGGAVLVAGIVVAAVVISSGGSASSGEPVRGNIGSAIQTLHSR